MRTLLFSLLFISLLSSCKESDETKNVVGANLFSLDVPVFLEEGKDLHPEATIQYQNLVKEFYVVVIHESKEEVDAALASLEDEIYTGDLKGYTQFLLDQVDMNVGIKNQSDIDNKLINSIEANTVTLESTVDGYDIFYTFCFIEGKENYYQVMTWTLSDRKDQYKDKMMKMVQSFKEL
jgi:hypothetical protein